MRRFISTVLIAASVLMGTLALNGCIVVPPRDHGYIVRHDGHDQRHDRDRDHDRDGDHWH